MHARSKRRGSGQRRALPIALLLSLAVHAQPPEREDAVEVIGVSPVPGLGVPRGQVPSNVQTFGSRALRERQPANLPDFIGRAASSVNVNEIQGNPFQPDVSFRGFTASPLLGTPQGLSVYQDGVRINAPFGDVVHWDLIPQRALENVTLIPGSNALFGLNTLGGALSLRTKSGDRNPGAELEFSAGSFGRRDAGFEFGRRVAAGAHFYAAGTLFKEDGWRHGGPSTVKQLYAKFGRRAGALDFDLGLALADTDLTGNDLAPQSFLERRREAIFTRPDNTRNRLAAPTLNARYVLSADSQLSGTLYRRRLVTHTLNGDVNDNFEDGPNDLAAGGTGANIGTAASNRTTTHQVGSGAALQWSLAAARHRLAVGVTHDRSRARFEQTAQLGVFDSTRGVIATDPVVLENALRGRTSASGVYVTDTLSLRPGLHVTMSARYDRARVRLTDAGPSAPALDGDHRFAKLNPALGLAFELRDSLTLYGGFAQGSRAPTPIELGCADPARPCTLPNALAADPPLKQVVARTLELGARGRLESGVRWNAGVFQTGNRDDILFVGTTTSAGFFRNFGKTRRRGVELGASGAAGSTQWSARYSLVQASFQSGACIVSENNSSRGTSAVCSPPDGAGGFLGDDLIEVRPGDRIPGIPEHSLKLALDVQATPQLRIGADLQAFSGQFARGNENNRHRSGTFTDLNGAARTFLGSGKLPGYAVVNLNARLDLGGGWELLAKVNNLFDRRYFTAGALAENPFDAADSFRTDSDSWERETFFSPGAPRAGWIGLRYRLP
jgi:outer membrane receptor protein involved in Fe transport